MLNFDYYWRVEPGIEYYCDLDYDPFVFVSLLHHNRSDMPKFAF